MPVPAQGTVADMILGFFRKTSFAILGRFSIIVDIFDPRILIFAFKKSMLLEREIREARFRFRPEFRASSQISELATGISNVRLEFRTFEWNLESSA